MNRICVDIDGVLANWAKAFRELLVEQGADIKPFDELGPMTWRWPKVMGATSKQVSAAWEHITLNPDWWTHIERHKEFTYTARAVLVELMKAHDVVFVTNRRNGWRQTAGWLKFYAGGMPQVISTKTKTLAFAALRPVAIIDDKLDILQEYRKYALVNYSEEIDLILPHREYNKGDREGLIVVGNTEEALRRCL